MMSSNSPYNWTEPRCLIESDEAGNVHTNPDTISLLEQITDPVVVVGIVGLYRTGKSHLMNKLAGGQNGFALGATIQSKTKGIWVWCVPHPTLPNCCLVLLDTEGLGDVEKGDQNHDVKIFALTVLLTGTLVYNSVGAINQDAIEKINFVSTLAERVKVTANSTIDDDDSSQFERFFPNFVWTLRDCYLELEKDGKQITEDQYLDEALKFKQGKSRAVSDYNLPRDCIRTYFPHPKCFCFPMPVNDQKLLTKMDTLNENDLNPVFREQTKAFLEHVFVNTPMKSVNGININGRFFAGFAKSYVDAICNGAIPCIETALATTAKVENERAIVETVQRYKNLFLESIQFPTDTMQVLSEAHHESERQAFDYFIKVAIFDTEKVYYAKMKDEIQKSYQEFCDQNEKASKIVCVDLLNSLHAPINEATTNGDYARPGGYSQYESDMNELVEKYKATPRTGVKADEVLNQFLKTQDSTMVLVLRTDERLSDEMKKLEDLYHFDTEETRKAVLAEEERRIEEENRRQLEQRMRENEMSNAQELERLKTQHEKENLRILEETKKLIESKMREQELLAEEGFKDRAQQMSREIEDLKSRIEQQRQESAAAAPGGIIGLLGDLFIRPLSTLLTGGRR